MTNSEANATKNPKRKYAMLVLATIFLCAGLLWLVYWLIWEQFEEYTDDAYVNGNMVQIMPQVPGTVVAVYTDDTRFVAQGDVLIQLDPTDLDVALQNAEATLAQTVREVRQSFENAQRAQSAVIESGATLIKAEADYKRRLGLVGEQAVSAEEMQSYTTARKTAQAQYSSALHNLRSAMAIVENSYVYTHPLVERAKANFKTAYLNRQRITILAPVAGYVARRNVQVGQQVSLNSAMLAIIPLNQIWVDANYKESQLNRIRINQPVTLYADAFPDVTYHGKVTGLSPGTGSAFAILPPQNATGNWIKIVQRLPVRIVLDRNEIKKNPLLLGLSMRVTIDTYHTEGSRLASVNQRAPVYQTHVYDQQLADADRLIAAILESNSPNLYMPKNNLVMENV